MHLWSLKELEIPDVSFLNRYKTDWLFVVVDDDVDNDNDDGAALLVVVHNVPT